MCINFVHNHTFGTEAKPICHLATAASHLWKMQFRVQPVLSLSRANSFLSSFLLKYFPAAVTTRAPSSSRAGLSRMVKAQILFLVVPPRSDQRLQQQLHSQSLRAFVQFLLPASILANIKFFLLTSKASENRIPAHIKGDYKFFLPSGAFCTKI